MDDIYPQQQPSTLGNGRYTIIKPIGKGSMGIVYRAFDEELQKDIAIKILPEILHNKPKALAEIKEEAHHAVKLEHENIVSLYRFVDDEPVSYFCMEYVEGQTLEEYLQQRSALPLQDVIAIARQIAQALDYTHSIMLHRDVKPANIMITSDGTCKLEYAGIGCQIKQALAALTGQLYNGSFVYMSPEQLMDDELDHRSDIYSFACTIYELLCGHPPFYKGYIGEQIRIKPVKPIVSAPDYVNRALMRALAKIKEDRFDSCKSFIDSFSNVRRKAAVQSAAAPASTTPASMPPSVQPSISGQPPLYQEWPFNAFEAKHRQEATARVLGIPLTFTNSIGMEFILIPTGLFEMGSSDIEAGRDEDELLHTVIISKPFYMAKYPVTQEQWGRIMGFSRMNLEIPDSPIYNISWMKTQEFVETLMAHEQRDYRLPTEAEWEYAARAGSPKRYIIGETEDDLAVVGWYCNNAKSAIHPVGHKLPNAFGLYDVLGNVWEWCQDYHGPYPTDMVKNPKGAPVGEYRILRGGAWNTLPLNCRVSYRLRNKPVQWFHNLGFRVVYDPIQ